MRTQDPIILIGTNRSGTTWLGSAFAQHPRLAYWPEPRHVWTWGNAYRPDYLLTASDATPKIRRHIRSAIERYVREQGRERLAEKTPSNCLRVGFIHAVLPEARLVVIKRDGRSVLRSTQEIIRGGMPPGKVLSRALRTPIWEWPAYVPRATQALARKVMKKPLDYWGPRPPGWREWLASDPMPVVLAKVWSATIRRAVEDARQLPPGKVLEITYEGLMREPARVIGEVVSFLDLEEPAPVVDYVVKTADASRMGKWREELDAGLLEQVRPHMEPTLNWLGYEW